MEKLSREEVHLVAQNSDANENTTNKVLVKHVYPHRNDWHKFLKWLFLAFGMGFSIAGVLFFFAYNWADLHKFVKIGLIEFLIVAISLIMLSVKCSEQIKNMMLTAASVLVGILFAVYGQIYQTGANAYDFFLGWTMFITLWTIVSNFTPLWLIYVILVNTSFILYAEQVAHHWTGLFVLTILFGINTLALLMATFFKRYSSAVWITDWFLRILSIAVVTFATAGVIAGIYGNISYVFLFLIVSTVVVFWLGVKEGIATKSLFNLAIIALSLIAIIAALLIKISSDSLTFLFLTLFIPGSVTILIIKLINLKKTWANEQL